MDSLPIDATCLLQVVKPCRHNLHIVIRDVMFRSRRSYSELLKQSGEGIASNILADRLKRLTASGLLTRRSRAAGPSKAFSRRGYGQAAFAPADSLAK